MAASAPATEENTLDPILMEVQVLPVVNYAIQQNRLPMLQSLTIENRGGEPLRGAELTITPNPAFCQEVIRRVDLIPAASRVDLAREIKLRPDGGELACLTEKVSGTLTFTLTKEGETLAQTVAEVSVLAFDEWPGYGIYPELVAAFANPNHPAVAGVLTKAAGLLEQWTGDPSLVGYLRKEPDWVLKQAAAIYVALQQQNIVYSVLPASFENQGQRLRLGDMVLEQQMGNGIELTLLYAACLEACGLHPLVVFKPGHAFLGLWLEEITFQEAVQYDPALLTKRLADGVNEIAVVESTCLTAGSRSVSFDEACRAGERHLEGETEVHLIVDIRRARLSGITPLPQRIATDQGWEILPEKRPEKEGGEAPENFKSRLEVEEMDPEAASKMAQWERKLLDLGLRNTLINLRLSKTMIPILTPSIDDLEDALAGGRDFYISYRPAEWTAGEKGYSFEDLHQLSEIAPLLQSEFENRRLRSALGEGELKRTVKELYRAAKASLEENGANTLYLAMGLLRWYETDRSSKARYAPLVLVPVDIVRQSANMGYLLRLRDDEPQMNITMLEKLKQDFGINVSGLDPLPTDQKGIDVRKVFTVLRKAVMAQERWDVLESAYLGIFSFSQFVMWNDMRNRTGDLMKNKIVSSLVEGRLTWEAGELTAPEKVSEEEAFLPLPADASQLFAIQAAGRGESFVLHGPPGTGKSQTITALIANVLAQGKTVLFVAEKMAALEVVRNRLEQIGIGPFCLELHSNRSRKRDVLDQLKKVIEITRETPPEEFSLRAEQIAALRLELDDYAQALHQVHPCGKSLFQLMNDYEGAKNAPELPGRIEDLERLTGPLLEEQLLLLQRLVAAARGVGHPKDHPLLMVGCGKYTQRLRMELPGLLASYQAALADLKEAAGRCAAGLEEPAPQRQEEYRRLGHLSREMLAWESLPADWAKMKEVEKLYSRLQEMIRHFNVANAMKVNLLKDWQETFLAQDGETLKAQHQENRNKWFIGRMLGANDMAQRLAPYARRPINKNDLGSHLNNLAAYQTELRLAKEQYESFGKDWIREKGDLKELLDQVTKAKESALRLALIPGGQELRLTKAGDPALIPQLKTMHQAWQEADRCRKELYEMLQLAESPATGDWTEGETARCAALSGRVSEMKNWMAWKALSGEAREKGLSLAVRAYEHGMAHEDVIPAWQKTLARALIVRIIDESPVLSSFSGPLFDEKIGQFRQMDEKLTELTRKEIACRLSARIPNFAKEAAQSSEVGKLQKAIRSGGRGISIRNLFEQIPNLLPRLCPCMLMSPISAAQYLTPDREPFDLVVFDEASQLPTCKAVGALARGRDAVIVGDPNQMPPTSFFATNTVDEDNLDLEDLESILEDCLALNMPQAHLLWHYRSRHESLIAFSNSQFYENKLYTFPSVNDRESKVSLVQVNGIFDRSRNRQNREEAEAIVAEIKRRFADPVLRRESIGVVTFNISQQHLIDDLLTQAAAEDARLEAWAYGGEEPIFIKNLENVQGDERDVILFSVSYGPDREGRIFMNFGPLNREGGWRRLNVAVSRARQEMVVFASLTPDQINLTRTSARGVAELRHFLEYAGGRQLSLNQTAAAMTEEKQSAVAEAICKALEEAGYETAQAIGHSAYRMDIGVVDPEEPERYLLGILLDGESYGSAKTTRDRELAQISVLRGLGWELHRLWSMDWWDSPERELAVILEKLEEAKAKKAQPPQEEPEEEQETAAEGPAAVNGPASLPKEGEEEQRASQPQERKVPLYEPALLTVLPMTAEEFLEMRNAGRIGAIVRTIVAKEAPISENLLDKRVLQALGIGRSSGKINNRLTAIYSALGLPKTEQDGLLFYWQEGQIPDGCRMLRSSGEGDRKREIRDLPIQEAANALCLVLLDQVSMLQSDLLKEGARLLGYHRVTPNVSALFTNATGYALARGWLELSGDRIWKLSEAGEGYAAALSEGLSSPGE